MIAHGTITHHIKDQDNALSTIDAIFIGKSAKSVALKKLMAKVASRDTTVLILGETGSGKDVAAQALHAASGRSGECVAINCAAIPAELLESELFGHEKGSFTGAERRHIGQFELAQDGTLFLDEIGDMPLALQSKLLRVLETRKFRRVGGSSDVTSNFRLVAATHRDLRSLVKEGKFREDLMYRLGVLEFKIPPLRDRTADIPVIIKHIVSVINAGGRSVAEPSFTMDAMRILANYDWPGNVRELRNVVERALVFFENEHIDGEQTLSNLIDAELPAADLCAGSNWHIQEGHLPNVVQFQNTLKSDQKLDLRGYLRDIEATLIEDAVNAVDGNVSLAATNLGLQRTTLIEKMKKLDIKRR